MREILRRRFASTPPPVEEPPPVADAGFVPADEADEVVQEFFVESWELIDELDEALERIVFRTGEIRRFPNADTPTDQDFDVPDPGEVDREAIFLIRSVKTEI